MNIGNALSDIWRTLRGLESRMKEAESSARTAPAHWGRPSHSTISGDTITATKPHILLTPESGTSDNLIRIENYSDGKIVLLRTARIGDTITVKHEAVGGNIHIEGAGSGNDRPLTKPSDSILFIYDEATSRWQKVAPETLDSLSGVALNFYAPPADGEALVWDAVISAWTNKAVAGGAGALDDLSDVTLTAPINGQALIYNGSLWVNAAVGVGALGLNDLSDATITAPSSGQVLSYNGSLWVNAAPAAGASALNDLTDVTIAAPANGQLLRYNSVGGIWENYTPVASRVMTVWNDRGGTVSGSAYTFKGNIFTPRTDVTLYGLAYIGNFVAGATYQAVVTTDAAGLITSIVKSPAVTLPGSGSGDGGWIWFTFTTPVVLSTGTTYGLAVGRTDSTDTYVLPSLTAGLTLPFRIPMPGVNDGSVYRIASTNPIVGTASLITASAGFFMLGYRFESSE